MVRDDVSNSMLPTSPVGLFYTWWREDVLPILPGPSELTIELDPDRRAIHRLTGLPDVEIEERFDRGNQVAIGLLSGEPAGIGWSCAGQAEIGELGLDFMLPLNNRYVWDFVTLAEWRGLGIYPALLQAFIWRDSEAERFWVGHDLDNIASRRGILKAGFKECGAVYAVDGVGPVFVPGGSAPERANLAAAVLDIPIVDPIDEYQ